MRTRERVAALVDRIGNGAEGALEKAVPRLAAYLDLLESANLQMNLVSRRTTAEELVERHLADSLLGLSFLPRPGNRHLRMVDVGSGGGFPAIPILLARPDIQGVLVDSIGKKCRFLSKAVEDLGLTAEVVNARFPDSFPMISKRFDLLTSRAVAEAGALARRAAPFLAENGRALLWTTEPLVPQIEQESDMHRIGFERAPGSERRGVVCLERFT